MPMGGKSLTYRMSLALTFRRSMTAAKRLHRPAIAVGDRWDIRDATRR